MGNSDIRYLTSFGHPTPTPTTQHNNYISTSGNFITFVRILAVVELYYFLTCLKCKLCSHVLKLNENDPVGEGGRKEGGYKASVDVEKSTS